MSPTKTERAPDTKEKRPPSQAVYSVHDAIEAVGFGRFQIVLSIIAGLAWMADSMEIMLLALISPALVCEWGISPLKQALCTTFVFLGWSISAPLWGWFCDRFGRKKGLILAAIWGAVFGVGTAFAPSYEWFVGLRAMVGFAVGGVAQATTIYTEFLPNKARAKCIILLEVFWAVGAAFESLLALAVVEPLGWPALVGLSSTPLALFAVLCWWVPESARYHVTRGQMDKASATLERVARMNRKELPEGTMVPEPTASKSKPTGIRGLLSKQLRVTTVLVWIIWWMVTFAYYGLSLFTPKLLQNGGECHGAAANNGTVDLTACKPMTTQDYVDTMATSFAELPGLLVTVLIIEWLGRKRAMALEFTIFSIAVLSLYACMGRTLMVAIIFVARAFVAGGYQAAYVYTPEVYPTTLRASGLGAANGMSRIAAMLTPLVAQVASDSILLLPLGVYGVTGIIAAIASLLLPIETRGREMKYLWPAVERLLKSSMGNRSEDITILRQFLRAMQDLRITNEKAFKFYNQRAIKLAISLEWSEKMEAIFEMYMEFRDRYSSDKELLVALFEKYYFQLPIRSKCDVHRKYRGSYLFERLVSASQMMRTQICNNICNNKITRDDDIAELITCSINVVHGLTMSDGIWFELQARHKIFDHMYRKRPTFVAEFVPVLIKTIFVVGGALIDAASRAGPVGDESATTYGAIGIAVAISQDPHHFQWHNLDTKQQLVTGDDWAVAWARRIESKLRVRVDLSKPLNALKQSDFNARVQESEKRNRSRRSSQFYCLADNNTF